MSGIWGNKIKLSIFGESHGNAIGITMDGLPPGIELDLEYIKKELDRRAPGSNELTTQRRERDQFSLMSGFFQGKTTGTPLCAMIMNENTVSKDYDKTKELLRPSHGDYTGYIKYKGFNDYRGGGHFSGRLTAPLVFVGAVCRQILEQKDIYIGSHIKRILDIEDRRFEEDNINRDTLNLLRCSAFPLLDKNVEAGMKEAIIKVKAEQDSVGGIIEAAAINLPAGIGEPFFDSVESTLAHLLFSIPGIKGVEFGAGFEITKMKGSEANDAYYIENDIIKTRSNHNGGVLGGITNGMPLIFRVAVKPTASIGRMQETVDIKKRENAELSIIGRHDPCIVPRALPVIEAVTAIAVYDMILLSQGEWRQLP